MIYCTYEEYTAKGGSMCLEEFQVWSLRASRKIDNLTMGRADKYASELKDELADACCQMADIMKQAADYRRSGGTLASASNDGYSESYRTPTEVEQSLQSALCQILSDALGNDPYNLLYRGVCGCW